MNYLQRLEYWGDHHHPKWIDLVRIALGIFLCYKGAEFAGNIGNMMSLMAPSVPFSDLVLIILAHYILFAHLMGGFLITVGLLTRVACVLLIPVLIGAIIFVNASPEMFGQFSELIVSILTLGLLIYFLIIGSGPWSLDRVIAEKKQS